MPVITFFQTKGGTGKSTSAFVLAELIAKHNSCTVIEADQNEPFAEWEKDGGKGQGFKIRSVVDPKNQSVDDKAIAPLIHKTTGESAFVIVDTEGTANQAAANAVAVSDLVIITSCGNPLDQKAAAKAFKFVRGVSKKAGKDIPTRILLTRQPAVALPRTIRQAIDKMRERKIPIFETQLIQRDAFAAIFGYQQTLFNLDPKLVNDPMKSYANARIFVTARPRKLD